MTENLEGDKTPNEGEQPTKEAAPTQEEEKPTVSVTETPEFRKALDEALGKGLASTNKQLSLQKAEADKHRAVAEQYKVEMEVLSTQIKDIQSDYDKMMEERLTDDPEARRAFLDRKAIAEEKRQLAKEKAEAKKAQYDAEMLAYAVRMGQRAQELQVEFGIDIKDLEECQTEEEMEVKALRFKLTQTPEKPEEPPPPVFAGPGSGKGGKDISQMTPDELLKKGFEKYNK